MRPIVITGFMGSGKSKVARELALRLNVSMVDLDESITQNEGRTPAQLIVEEGEPAFRSIESNALRKLLEEGSAGVIALGGGAWIQEENRDLIKRSGCLAVWLDVPFDVCWLRIETSVDDRPLGKTIEQTHALYNRRRPIYELADVHIEVLREQSFDDLISHIANWTTRLPIK